MTPSTFIRALNHIFGIRIRSYARSGYTSTRFAWAPRVLVPETSFTSLFPRFPRYHDRHFSHLATASSPRMCRKDGASSRAGCNGCWTRTSTWLAEVRSQIRVENRPYVLILSQSAEELIEACGSCIREAPRKVRTLFVYANYNVHLNSQLSALHHSHTMRSLISLRFSRTISRLFP